MAKVSNVKIKFVGDISDVVRDHNQLANMVRKIDKEQTQAIRRQAKEAKERTESLKASTVAIGTAVGGLVVKAFEKLVGFLKQAVQYAIQLGKELYNAGRDSWQTFGRLGIAFERVFSDPNKVLKEYKELVRSLSSKHGIPIQEMLQAIQVLNKYPLLVKYSEQLTTMAAKIAEGAGQSISTVMESLGSGISKGQLRTLQSYVGLNPLEGKYVSKLLQQGEMEKALRIMMGKVDEYYGHVQGRTRDALDMIGTEVSLLKERLGSTLEVISADLGKIFLRVKEAFTSSNFKLEDFGKSMFIVWEYTKRGILAASSALSVFLAGMTKVGALFTRYSKIFSGAMGYALMKILGVSMKDVQELSKALDDASRSFANAGSNLLLVLGKEMETTAIDKYKQLMKELQNTLSPVGGRGASFSVLELETFDKVDQAITKIVDKRTEEKKLLDELYAIQQRALRNTNWEAYRIATHYLNKYVATLRKAYLEEKRLQELEKKRQQREQYLKQVQDANKYFDKYKSNLQKAREEIAKLNEAMRLTGKKPGDIQSLRALYDIVSRYASSLEVYERPDIAPIYAGTQEAYSALYGKKKTGTDKLIEIAGKQLGLNEQTVQLLERIHKATEKNKVVVLGD